MPRQPAHTLKTIVRTWVFRDCEAVSVTLRRFSIRRRRRAIHVCGAHCFYNKPIFATCLKRRAMTSHSTSLHLLFTLPVFRHRSLQELTFSHGFSISCSAMSCRAANSSNWFGVTFVNHFFEAGFHHTSSSAMIAPHGDKYFTLFYHHFAHTIVAAIFSASVERRRKWSYCK